MGLGLTIYTVISERDLVSGIRPLSRELHGRALLNSQPRCAGELVNLAGADFRDSKSPERHAPTAN